MSIQYFNLFDGSLEFHNDRLIIFDKAKRNRTLILLTAISFLFSSITICINGYKRHDNEGLLFGLTLTTIWIIVLIFRRKEFQKVENEIFLSNINHVTFSIDKLDGSIVANVLTKNGLQRKIKILQDDNQGFAFKNLLVDNKIKVD